MTDRLPRWEPRESQLSRPSGKEHSPYFSRSLSESPGEHVAYSRPCLRQHFYKLHPFSDSPSRALALLPGITSPKILCTLFPLKKSSKRNTVKKGAEKSPQIKH